MNYYEELGIPRTASEPEIRRAYKQLVRLLHPDQYPDEQMRSMADLQMRRLNGILEVLTDPTRRRRYDAGMDAPAEPPDTKHTARSNAVSGMLRRCFRPGVEPATWVFLLGIAAVVGLAWWFGMNTGKTEGQRVARQAPSGERAGAPEGSALEARNRPPAAGPAVPSVAALPATGIQEGKEKREPASDLRKIEPRRPEGQAPRAQVRQAEPPPPVAGERPEPEPRTPDPNAARVSAPPPASSAAAPVREVSPARGFAGKWLYVPPAARAGRQDLYPPEYIELTIDEQAGLLRGRYKARYRVADRAISPVVSFQFEGRPEAAGASFPWTGPGGAAGQVTLKLNSETAMRVSWSADRLGELGLVSGEATLVRRQE